VAGDHEDGFAFLTLSVPRLRALVRSPWSAWNGESATALPGIIAPDAHVEFVFQLGSPLSLSRPGRTSEATPRAMIYAQRHGTLRLVPTGANAVVAFRTTPVVASVILGRPLADCWDRPIDLSELIGSEAERLVDLLAAAPPSAGPAVLEPWLLSRLTDWDDEHERNLALQRKLLWQVSGEPIAALSDEVGITDRTLRRHFARHAALSPKQLSMSGRILRACADLSDRRETRIVEVALRAGFGDQSAFTNAFRHYVGMTPAELRREPVVFCERA
jgi:AraC-like DNA-binding protein